MTKENREPASRGLLRLFARSAPTLVLVVGWSGATSAATISDRYTTARVGGTYDTQELMDADPGSACGDCCSGAPSCAGSLGGAAFVPDASPIATAAGAFGIVRLSSDWLGAGSSQASTGLTGTSDSTAMLIATLSTDGFHPEYDSALADGREYDKVLTAKGSDPSPVPLTPIVLLLGSAVAGLTLKSRRRATEASNRP